MFKILFIWICRLLMFERILVQENQRVLVFRDGTFLKILSPGTYWFFKALHELTFENHDITQPQFCSEWTDVLLKNHKDEVADCLTWVDILDHQVALVSLNGKAYELLPLGARRAYWTVMHELDFEVIDTSQNLQVPPEKVPTLMRLRSNHFSWHIVTENSVGLLFVNGQLTQQLGPGGYAFWKTGLELRFEILDLRVQQVEVVGQEILTKDRVSLRVNLTAHYQVMDPVKAKTQVVGYSDMLYKYLQFGLREAIGGRNLDELLLDKNQLNEVVFSTAKNQIEACGVELKAVGIKDIILPGEIRDIMNQVVEAQKRAEANLIKRREETAATRSLLNTAKLMQDNPTLLRLKELEALEKVTDKIDNLHVYNGVEGLMNNLVPLAKS